ncbi:MAG: mechanosensitive ion channel family protein [Ferruginibacter sp.]|nr:mechanosensitive ion channel family protein [Ferruginibacter sp.]
METSEEAEAKEIEIIKNDQKVKSALKESSINPQRESAVIKKEDAPILGVTAIIFLVCGILYFLLGWKYFPIPSTYIPFVQRIVLSVMFISLVLVVTRILKKVLNKKIEDTTTLYNFNRIADLFAFVTIFTIILSLLFANWYAALVSFGIMSLILGFALQNPITSFFAWIYILIRKPYEVGDRIKIGNVYGDVISVSYIDTTLWEFNGDYLSGDHPSGRIIRFVNSKVFNEYVYNYSWPLFPFIWNEMKLFVSYDSDLKFTGEIIRQIVEKEVGEAMVRRVKRFKKILSDTPVDELEVSEYPSVIMRAHDNMWIEVIVRYLVEPKNTGRIKKKLFESLMEELKKYPEKIIFPKTNMP